MLNRISVFKVNNNYTQNKTQPVSVKASSVQNYGPSPFNAVFNNISFQAAHRTVQDIEIEQYKSMSPHMRKFLRKKVVQFNEQMNVSELNNASKRYLPLLNEKDMNNFLKISSIYSKYKDQPIICLGRSPKWFLNASLWMKDGIDDYKFVAFSKYWYHQTPNGLRRIDALAPTKDEEKSYHEYLKRTKADPLSIVNTMKETGKKTVITDYLHTGKGACSFIEMMGNLAEQQGVLEDFAKSIQIVGIGSMEYLENFYHYDDEISEPRVPMPPILKPYNRDIKQEFYNMPLRVFEQMLTNENTNECRATYYPHEAWTVYQPDKFKTGIMTDSKLEEIREKHPRYTNNFSHAMRDYRNLLNFHIIDSLQERGLLKD